jgi:hypothetical protein
MSARDLSRDECEEKVNRPGTRRDPSNWKKYKIEGHLSFPEIISFMSGRLINASVALPLSGKLQLAIYAMKIKYVVNRNDESQPVTA